MIAGRLISVVVLVMLTFAPMVSSVSAQNSTLTPSLLNNLLGLTARKGNELQLPSWATKPLGLPAGWIGTVVAVPESRVGFYHSFAISKGSDQDIIFTLRAPDSVHLFRTRRDGTLISAAVVNLDATLREGVDMQNELRAELALWDSKFQNVK
jgi:hypothetical protein